jgi:hypothetical protein
MWHDDGIFATGGALHGEANPVFRLTGYFPYHQAHPYVMPDGWQALFDCFVPLVREHCDKIIVRDRPGAKARRSKRIVEADWRPFHQLAIAESDVAAGIFTGFSFLDRADGLEGNGRRPCSVRFFVGSSIRFEACIPLQDWTQGRLPLGAVIEALHALPYVSVMAGYGLSLGQRYAGSDAAATHLALSAYAERYPVIDVARDEDRSFFPGSPRDYPLIGICGINWLSGIGEPFRSRAGGAKALVEHAPSDIKVADGPFGTLFRLGAEPISGEAGVDDSALPHYSWLGSRLSPAWNPEEDDPRAPVFVRGAQSKSLVWERRFYG